MTFSINFKCLDKLDIKEQITARLKSTKIEYAIEGNRVLVDMGKREILIRLLNTWLTTLRNQENSYTISAYGAFKTDVAKWRIRIDGKLVGWIDVTTKE